MRVFITGICGYLGSALAVRLARRGFVIAGVDNLLYEQSSNKFESLFSMPETRIDFNILDVRNTEILRSLVDSADPDVVVHFGDLSSVYSCSHNSCLTDEINVAATKNLIDLCSSRRIPMLYNSTSSVYGMQSVRLDMKESDTLPNGLDNYCTSKLAIEKYLISKSTENSSFRFTAFRPATVFGLSPRFRIELLPNHFCWSAVKTGIMRVSDLNASRAFISVESIIEIYRSVLESSRFMNRVYNIGTYNLTKLDIALAIQEITDAKIVTSPDVGDRRNLRISSDSFEADYFKIPKPVIGDELVPVVDFLQGHKEEILTSNYREMLNMPLDLWSKLI